MSGLDSTRSILSSEKLSPIFDDGTHDNRRRFE